MPQSPTAPLQIAILGAGNRGADVYGELISRRAERARVTAVADPRRERLEEAARRFGLAEDALFADPEALLSEVQALDAVVVATPDRQHVAPTVAALARGLDVLLEKPIAPDPDGIAAIREAAGSPGAGAVTVAHVLRYTPFFRTLKELLDGGRIGRLIAIEATENIGHYHFAHSYVRGNWRREDASSPMILAKSCHDLDILRWLAGDRCTSLTSVGGLAHFRPENAPEGSTERCTDGCAVERTCPYSAIRIYLERFGGSDDWPNSVVAPGGDERALMTALRDGPYGRCVYRSDNDVVDHQLVQLRFANDVKASLTVHAFSERITRDIHLAGTHGEIHGNLEAGRLELDDFARGRSERIDVGGAGARHGGGDDGLVVDFLERLWRRRRGGGAEGDAPSGLAESVESHRMAFAAEASRKEGRSVALAPEG
ncbi:MAG TPA: Gfo/Idh/MocA family oxidoreductase [Trueperaceae bacterium]|nr:Gfo/Idh/MocA family oxidoreductase [Trueperaceae bacterium]